MAVKVHPSGKHEERAVEIAAEIAKKSKVIVALCRDAVNAAVEQPLSEGLKTERHLFYSCYATEDRVEGMKAFVEKRKPAFQDK